LYTTTAYCICVWNKSFFISMWLFFLNIVRIFIVFYHRRYSRTFKSWWHIILTYNCRSLNHMCCNRFKWKVLGIVVNFISANRWWFHIKWRWWKLSFFWCLWTLFMFDNSNHVSSILISVVGSRRNRGFLSRIWCYFATFSKFFISLNLCISCRIWSLIHSIFCPEPSMLISLCNIL